MYDDKAIGYRLTALALGMDALEREGQSSESLLDNEGLVPIFIGGELIKPLRFSTWDEVECVIDELEDTVTECPAGPRRSFLGALLRSLRAAMRLFRGESLSFEEKLTDLVGVPAGEADPAVIVDLHDEIDRALSRRGYVRGSLRQRVERWQNSRFIPVERIPVVYEELQEEAVRRTSERIFDLGDFRMELRLRPGTYSAGRCSFSEAVMELNPDIGVTRAAIKHLVTHENFPGHATQLLYTLDAYQRGEAPADVLLCTLNGVTGVIQEGIGDQATELIDWVEDDDDVIQIALRRLRIAAATTASWRLMQLQRPEEEVVRYLRETGFAIDPYVDGRITQARHPFRGPFNASYFYGNQAVRELRLRTPPAHYDQFIRYLYGNMHSLEGFRSFQPGK
jgi:hypothetical protein